MPITEVVTNAAEAATTSLLDRGILGVMAMLCLGVAVFFYREKRAVEARERGLYDRHLAKAEEWITAYNEHASDMKAVLESLSRRM